MSHKQMLDNISNHHGNRCFCGEAQRTLVALLNHLVCSFEKRKLKTKRLSMLRNMNTSFTLPYQNTGSPFFPCFMHFVWWQK